MTSLQQQIAGTESDLEATARDALEKEQDAQFWEDLKIETGFSSYVDYMEAHKDDHDVFPGLLEKYKKRSFHSADTSVYDICLKENNVAILSPRSRYSSGSQLVRALRQPPSSARVQLVLLHHPSLPEDLLHALGLGLKLDPQVLDVLSYANLENTISSKRQGWPSISKYVVSDEMIAAISHEALTNRANAIPIVFLGFNKINDSRVIKPSEYQLQWETNPQLFHRAISGNDANRRYETKGYIIEKYITFLRFFLGQTHDQAWNNATLILSSFSPLIYAEARSLRSRINTERQHFATIPKGLSSPLAGFNNFNYDNLSHGEYEEDLNNRRLLLRRHSEHFQDTVDEILRYVRFEVKAEWSQEHLYDKLRTESEGLLKEASRLETEIRDNMQVQVGSLALQESRKSIELSNLQIREARSVKLFTVLAFIYIPMNLATSIFGMNIQQLNQNGQNLWVFLITAITTLLITGGLWSGISYINNSEGIEWYKEREREREEASTAARDQQPLLRKRGRRHSFITRLTLIVWLVRNGHTLWMWKSGALSALLLDAQKFGLKKKSAGGPWEWTNEFGTASNYVMDTSHLQSSDFDPFQIKPEVQVQWNRPW